MHASAPPNIFPPNGVKGPNSHHGDGIIVEDGGNVFGGELIRRVTDEEASLAHGTIPDYHTSA